MVKEDTLVLCNVQFVDPYVPAGQPGHLVLGQLTVTYTPMPRGWCTQPTFEEDTWDDWLSQSDEFPLGDVVNPKPFGENTNCDENFVEGGLGQQIIAPVYNLDEWWREDFYAHVAQHVADSGPNHGLYYNGTKPYTIARTSRFNH